MQERVLIVDDDKSVRSSLRRYLQRHGFDVDEADSCASAEAKMRAFEPQVALVDYRLPDGEAIRLLPRLRTIDPSCKFLILTGYGSIDLAVRTVKEGASEFLTKPVDMAALLRAIQIGVSAPQRRAAAAENEPVFGNSEAMANVRARLDVLRDGNGAVLFVGPDGVGRRTLARYLHASSARAEGPFVEVDTAKSDVERTLFGFDSVDGSRPGVLDAAAGGTVLIRDLHRATPSLVRRIDEYLADPNARSRVIATSELDPGADERFAGYVSRLREGMVYVPALRQRPGDILPLTRHLLTELARRHGRENVSLAADAERALVAHHWPGNIRELESVLESAMLLSPTTRLTALDVPIARSVAARVAKARRLVEQSGAPARSAPQTLEELERASIEQALEEESGNVGAAARRLGIPRSTLYHKLKVLGLKARGPAED